MKRLSATLHPISPPKRSRLAFDPAYPPDDALIQAGPLRGQFNGLLAMLQAIPVIQSALVESVQTLPAGSPAEAGVWLAGSELRFDFAIPQGFEGQQGAQGETGPQGPPFAQAVVDSVQTLNPGDPAWVQVAFDGSNVRFTFGIPQGQGGSEGSQGPVGPQGPPGEVTTGQLTSAISYALAQTSANSNAVEPLPLVVSDPPTQGEVQQVVDKVNELIAVLRR